MTNVVWRIYLDYYIAVWLPCNFCNFSEDISRQWILNCLNKPKTQSNCSLSVAYNLLLETRHFLWYKNSEWVANQMSLPCSKSMDTRSRKTPQVRGKCFICKRVHVTVRKCLKRSFRLDFKPIEHDPFGGTRWLGRVTHWGSTKTISLIERLGLKLYTRCIKRLAKGI